jgi:hypothetical protein
MKRTNWAQRVEFGTIAQEAFNSNMYYRATDMSAMAERQALEQGYEQYRGYFDWWFKVQIKKDIKTKMGQAFKAGDITIATFSELEGQKRLDVMSWRNGYVVTVISLDSAEAF